MAYIRNKLGITRSQEGAVAIIVAILISVLLGFAALAIDVGYMYATRNELQNVADAAALAGAGKLGSIYSAMSIEEVENYTLTSDEKAAIVTAVKDTAKLNEAAKGYININDEDITISVWDFDKYPDPGPDQELTENLINADAVRVIARRDSNSTPGAIATFFAKILVLFGGNTDTFSVSAVATAALSGPSNMMEGELNMPFGLSELNFPDNCNELVTFKDTTDSCAGWHNFFEADNANTIRNNAFDIIAADVVDDEIEINIPDEGFEGGSSGDDVNITNGAAWLNHYFGMTETGASTPETNAGDSFNFTGGVGPFMLSEYLEWTGDDNDVWTGNILDSGQTAPFPAMFDYFRMRDGDGDNSIWTGTVPVYEDKDTCTNPSGATKIVGFAIIEVRGWRGPPDNEIDVYIDCNSFVIDNGRSGGGRYGNLKGTIPSLVQ